MIFASAVLPLKTTLSELYAMKSESLREFYQRTRIAHPGIFTCKEGHFNVYNREHCSGKTVYRRRDFYKISLINEGGFIHYADKSIALQQPALVFSNPMIPYAFEPSAGKQTGYFCLFTEDFVAKQDKSHLLTDAPMFKPGGYPVFFIHENQQHFLSDIFERMKTELATDYVHKYALLYHYVQILIHEALKMRPAENYFSQQNASSRISDLFLELLERQFPVEEPHQGLKLRTPADYASRLSIHVNYLNRSVKENTGKTTSSHIADRIASEAKILLLHTTWNVNEIAYALGFEYPSYFNSFFRRHVSTTPRAFRSDEIPA